MNSDGLFGNFQENSSPFHLNIEKDRGTVAIADFYRDALWNRSSTTELLEVLEGTTVVYPPTPPDVWKLHNLFADRWGSAFVLESKQKKNDTHGIRGNRLVMSNFPHSYLDDEGGVPPGAVGLDRYQAVEGGLRHRSTLDVRSAMELLGLASQAGAVETLASLVFDPVGLKVYLCPKRQYENVWMVDIPTGTLSRETPRDGAYHFALWENAVLLSDLVER